MLLYAVVVEVHSRLAVLTPAFPANQSVGAVALAASVLPLIISTIVRRRLSSGSSQSPAVVTTSCVMSWAFASMPGVLGLLAYLLTALREAAYGAIALSLIAHALLFPRRSQWDEWTRRPGAPAALS